jgi:hypothetical protein
LLSYVDDYTYEDITVVPNVRENDFENLSVSGLNISGAKKTIPEKKVDALSMLTESKFSAVSVLMNSTTHVLTNSVGGAGLEVDGQYSANNSTNYLKTVTSLKAADEALDLQLKTTTDRVD